MASIESISVIPKSEVPADELAKANIYDKEGFVEIRVERENPIKVKIVDMRQDTPGKKFSKMLRESGLSF